MNIQDKRNRLKRNENWACLLAYIKKIYNFDGLKNSEQKQKWHEIQKKFMELARVDFVKVEQLMKKIHSKTLEIEKCEIENDENEKNRLLLERDDLEKSLPSECEAYIMNAVSSNEKYESDPYLNDVDTAQTVIKSLINSARSGRHSAGYIFYLVEQRKKDAIRERWDEYHLDANAYSNMREEKIPEHIQKIISKFYKTNKFNSLENFENNLKSKISETDYDKYIQPIESCLTKKTSFNRTDVDLFRSNDLDEDEPFGVEDVSDTVGFSVDGRDDANFILLKKDILKAIENKPKNMTEGKHKKIKYVFQRRHAFIRKPGEEGFDEIDNKTIATEMGISEEFVSFLYGQGKKIVQEFFDNQDEKRNGNSIDES
jgi:hypothetical protein